MKLSDYVVDFIAKQGVKHVFMLPGGGAMHLNDSLGRHPDLTFVCNLIEHGSAVAADAYAQYSGNLGVAMVTTGPGGTNAITGVAGAYLDSTPVLVVSGQVKRADRAEGRGVRQIGFQEIDIVSLVKPVTKYAVTVLEPKLIRAHLEEAVWHARSGRKGPVWVDIPLDVQATEIDEKALVGFTPPAAEDRSAAVQDAARKCAALLVSSKRPVFLVGNGVRSSGGCSAFLALAERLGAPVLTTWKALDFLGDEHPLYAGRPGAVGQRAANFAQQSSDLFISLGARLDYGQTAYNHRHFAPKAKRVVVDIDPGEIAKLDMDLEVALAADAGAFIQALGKELEGRQLPDWAGWRTRIAQWRKRYPIVLPEYHQVTEGVHNYVFIDVLGRLLKKGELLVPGSSGACSEVTCQALPTREGIRFINSQGLGSMGFGVAASVGACLAAGNKKTVCIEGDGGFPMNGNELLTAARFDLDLKCFVLNNNGYGAIRTTQINYFNKRFMACDPASGLTLLGLKAFAEATGVSYCRIETQKDLEGQLQAILAKKGPVLCEVVMTPGQFTQPKVSSKQGPDGKMVTMPMEDLWPFLPKEELESNLAN